MGRRVSSKIRAVRSQVKHRLADGFMFEPQKNVDWLVCDIVDKPARVSSLIIKWFGKELDRSSPQGLHPNLLIPLRSDEDNGNSEVVSV